MSLCYGFGMKKENKILSADVLTTEYRIFIIRDLKVMLDSDLAKLYGVATRDLNKAFKRNIKRFPRDFCFELNATETEDLMFQIGTSSSQHGGRRKLPYVFTEHGVAMLSAILKSEKAVAMSVFIVRAFIQLRESLVINKNPELEGRVSRLESVQGQQEEKITQINSVVVQLLRGPDKLMN